jgi:cytochrome c oxidase subunit 2
MRGSVRRNVCLVGAMLFLTLLLAACGKDLPQNTFEPAGPTAQQEKDVTILPLAIAGVVFLLVEGGIVYLALKYRHRKGRDRVPAQVHGNSRLEIGWTIAPAVVLAIVVVPAISLIWKLDRVPPDAMQIKVQGYQWWWGFQYLDEDMQTDYGQRGPITVADVLVIPVGQTINLQLEAQGGGARDSYGTPDHMVIHSFWAPRLFGKQDVIPGPDGADNHIVFSADVAGTYSGQCAEFCGLQHGIMRFRIVALEADAWQTWVANQKQPASTPTDALAKQGMDLFLGTNGTGGWCIACHAVGGTDAAATAGPNLSKFADPDHQCWAGCLEETFVNGQPNSDVLRQWLRDPASLKPGAKMPNYHLSEDQIDALVAYLYTLT